MIFFFALLGAAIVLRLASYDWRWSVKAALVITVIEGGLRKWVLPQASELIYFLKDGILLGAYLGYFLQNGFPQRPLARHSAFAGLLGAVAFVVMLEILNPALGSILVGLLGAKAYLFYVPLCLILPKLFVSVEQLRTYLQWFLLLCIPVGSLGVVQFFSPPDSAINVYAPSAIEVSAAVFGEDDNVRVTGTFPYIAGFAVYLAVCLAFNFALLMHLRAWKWRMLFVGMQLLLSADLVMTGSRGAGISAMGLVAGFVVFSAFERSTSSRRLAVLLVVAGVACVGGLALLFPSALEAFRQRATDSGDSVSDRIVQGLLEPFQYSGKSGVAGYGAGACQVACYALRDQLSLAPPLAYPPAAEGEPLRVMLELGIFGFFVWYALRIYLLVTLWLVSRRLQHPMLRHLALAAFLLHALFLTGQLVTNTTFSVFYWFLAGFVFLLPELDQRWLRKSPLAALKARPLFKPGLRPAQAG